MSQNDSAVAVLPENAGGTAQLESEVRANELANYALGALRIFLDRWEAPLKKGDSAKLRLLRVILQETENSLRALAAGDDEDVVDVPASEEGLISRLNKALVAFINACDLRRVRKTCSTGLLTVRQIAKAAHKELALAHRDREGEQNSPCPMCGQPFNRLLRPCVGARPLGA